MVFRRVKEMFGIGKAKESTPYAESKAYYSLSQAYLQGCLPPIPGRNDGYGYCLRCEGSWAEKVPHWTWYSAAAMGPLCEECYDSLTPEERWPYYMKLWEIWGRPEDVDLDILKRAIGLEPIPKDPCPGDCDVCDARNCLERKEPPIGLEAAES